MSTKTVADQVGATRETVSKRRKRFLEDRIAGLGDEPRPGRPRTVSDQRIADLIARTLESEPDNATHYRRGRWRRNGTAAVDRVAGVAGLRPAAAPLGDVQAVHRPVLRGQGARRRRALPRPARAGTGAMRGREAQIQATDRSQPVLPGVPERATHDYVHAGTTTLFAAFDAAAGKVVGSMHRRRV